MTDPTPPIVEGPRTPAGFYTALGMFHGVWLGLDVAVDYALATFLKIPHDDAHILTAGMEFGRKCRILIDLIKRSDHKKKAALIGSLRKIQASKRDAIAHSYLKADPTSLTFISRSRG